MQLIVMGSAITNEVKNITLVVVDEDRSPSSRRIIYKFRAVPLFEYLGEYPSTEEAVRSLDDGTAKTAIVIPRCFERDMLKGESPSLQVLIDGVDGNSAGISLGYILTMAAGIQKGWVMTRGMKLSGIEVVPRYFYNPQLESTLNFVPGLIGLLLLMITTMLTAVNIVREKEMGTLEQLMVTPLSGVELIIGKIIPYAVLGLMQFSMGIIAARVVFGITMAGNILLLYGITLLFIMSTLGLGIFFSTVANTQQQAMFVAWFSMVFTLLLSGFFVPIKNMPRFVQYLTYLNPLRYFITVLREIYLKGTPFRYLWREAAVMGGMGVALIVTSSLRFNRRLS